MKKLLASFVLLFVAACSSIPSGNSQLKTGYDTVNAYVEIVSTSLVRGRISPENAAKASGNAKKAVVVLDQAKVALAECKETLPCDKYTDLLKALQPSLLEFEMELRKQQGEVK